MAWCPVCRNEYKEGYTYCKDCDTDLIDVASLEELPKHILFGTEEEMKNMQTVLGENGIESSLIIYIKEENTYELFVYPKDVENAKTIISEHMQNQAQQEMLEEMGMTPEDFDSPEEIDEYVMEQASEKVSDEIKKKRSRYIEKKDRAEDYKSSGYALIPVGIIGLIIIALHAMGFIPIDMGTTRTYMMYLVMGTLFIIFIVFGVMSLKSAKTIEAEAVEEKAFLKEAEEFMESINIEELDAELDFEEDLADEMKYFKRIARLKQIIEEKYPEIDEALEEKLAEDFYDKKFDAELS